MRINKLTIKKYLYDAYKEGMNTPKENFKKEYFDSWVEPILEEIMHPKKK